MKDSMVKAEHMNIFRGVIIVLGILYISVLLIIYKYTQELENTGCACSTDWRRTYISWYVMIMIVFVLVQILVSMFGNMEMLVNVMGMGLVPFVLLILTVLFVIYTFQYVNRLKREKCKCSEGTGRMVLQILSWYYVIMWALQLIAALFTIALFAVAFKK
jgi:hypothetical protein